MSAFALILILTCVLGVAGLGAVAFVVFGSGSKRQADVRDLMGSTARVDQYGNKIERDIDEIKRQTGSANVTAKQDDLSLKLFRAGFFAAEDKRRFGVFRMIAPVVTTVLGGVSMFLFGNMLFTLMGVILGGFIGYAFPLSWLERKIRGREEETMYYLPLVIEQVSIGVSSSLDIGPCIAQIVTMADERDSHNPVTELFVHAERLIRSGLNLEDSLEEIGGANGLSDVKHAFMFLSQCSRHGGELSKQLQELAEAVTMQRQVQVEARIASLPVKATGPLFCVFAGFFALIFAGLFVRLLSAFGG